MIEVNLPRGSSFEAFEGPHLYAAIVPEVTSLPSLKMSQIPLRHVKHLGAGQASHADLMAHPHPHLSSQTSFHFSRRV